MKKIMLLLFIIFMPVISCAPVLAADLLDGIVPLGQDHAQMTWYLLNSGRTSGTGDPFAVVRKYYTNVGVKNETIELLMSKFGLDAEKAGNLYFTEYVYHYSKDLQMFAVGYIRHYDMVDQIIHRTEFDGLTNETMLTWVGVVQGGPSGLALDVVRRRERISAPRR